MRLKEDSSSWKGMGLKAKLEPVPEEPVRHSKKNTRKWCKGKVGTMHDFYLFKSDYFHWGYEVRFLDFRCSGCGKQLLESLHRA